MLKYFQEFHHPLFIFAACQVDNQIDPLQVLNYLPQNQLIIAFYRFYLD
ncbi:MAG: hypothetical protein RIQ89_1423 [Bacteroidota bacterium]|jgi:hypothetical protein